MTKSNTKTKASVSLFAPNEKMTVEVLFPDGAKQITISIVNVTPGMAEGLLEKNPKNRTLSDRRILAYKTEMDNHQWMFTHQGIAVDEDGHLVDGQHRLAALIRSGRCLDMILIEGLPRSVFSYIDRGKNRNARDLFQIEGYAVPDAIAAAARIAMLFERNNVHANMLKTRSIVSLDSMLEYVRKHESFSEDIKDALKWKTLQIYIGKAFLGGLYFSFKRKDPELAKEFYSLLNSGAIADENSVILQCRNKLINEKMNSNHRYLNPAYIGGLLVNAWNHLRDGNRDIRLEVDLTKSIAPIK